MKTKIFISMLLILILGYPTTGQSEDLIGFSLVSHTPAINKLNVPLNTTILLVFNDDVNTGTLAGNIRIFGHQTGLHTWTSSYNSTDHSVTLTPTGKSFKNSEKITVIVTREVKSSAGTALSRSYIWSFTMVVNVNYQQFIKFQDNISFPGEPMASILNDLDNDGDLDLVVTTHSTATLEVMKNDGTGLFGGPVTYSGNYLFWGTYAPKAFDFDNDGFNDIAVPSRFQARVSLWKNNGSGSFIANGAITTHQEPYYIIQGDYNGDGFTDLAVLCNEWYTQCIDVFFNNKTGGFTLHQTVFPIPQGERNLSTGVSFDLDNDEDLDIVFDQASTLLHLAVLTNDGSGTFSYTKTNLPSCFPTLGDLNADGYEDLSTRDASKIWILNNTGGTLSQGPSYDDQTANTLIKDFNADGSLDILPYSVSEQAIMMYRNDGSGNFTSTKVIEGCINPTPWGFDAGDIDGDGDLDVVSGFNKRMYTFKACGTGKVTTTFSGTGNWNDPARWDHGIPVSDANAVIDGTCTITTMAECFDLTINENRQLSINNPLNCYDILVKDNGTILGNSNITYPGIAKVERYIHGNWDENQGTLLNTTEIHFVSTPVTGTKYRMFERDALYSWHEQPGSLDNWPAQGSPPDLDPSQSWHHYWWNCNDYTPGTLDMTVGRGYEVATNMKWYNDSPAYPCPPYPYEGCECPHDPVFMRYFTGRLNYGEYPVNLTYTPGYNSSFTGYNLIGNPYPSAVNWNLVTKTNVYANSAAIWNQAAGNYTYLAGTDGTIPSTQSFFVQAASYGAGISFTESSRIHNNKPLYKSSQAGLLTLHVSNDVNPYWDETYLTFNPEASDGLDLYDGRKLTNLTDAPMIYTQLADGEKLAFNSMKGTISNPLLPVNFNPGIKAKFTISVSGIEGFNPDMPLFLEDVQNHDSIQNLRLNPNYTFQSDTNEILSRFILHLVPVGINHHDIAGIRVYSHEKNVFINIPSATAGTFGIYTMLGQEICKRNIIPGQLNKVTLNCSEGYYIVRVLTGQDVITRKVFID